MSNAETTGVSTKRRASEACGHQTLDLVLSGAHALPVDLDTTVVIGHRGMGVSAKRPDNPYRENTRESFQAAYAAGATWVELDVLPSADGDLMMIHDHFISLDQEAKTPRSRKAFKVPVWSVSTSDLIERGYERLDGLCDDLPDGLGLYLEAKVTPGDSGANSPSSIPALTRWAQTHATHRPILLASFDPFITVDLKTSGLATAWITNKAQHFHTAVMAAARADIGAIVVHGNTLRGPAHEVALATALARQHQIALWSWNPDPKRIARYRDLGITGFCVNDVIGAVAAISTNPATMGPAVVIGENRRVTAAG